MTVSVITPTTTDRHDFNLRIRDIVKRQDYPIHEHLFDFSNQSIGAKRNHLCSLATGDIIVHFDSDDRYAYNWVGKIIECIKENPDYDIYGLKDLYYTGGYKYTGGRANNIVMGATMAYRREFWETHKFEDKNIGEDIIFCKGARVFSMDYADGFLATLHDGNTCKKNVSGKAWTNLSRQEM